MLKSVKEVGSRAIDYRMAWLGAAAMGSIVLLVNSPHGIASASVAALKQAVYTFFFAGLITRACERLAIMEKDRRVAMALAIVIPSLMAIGFTYIVHSMRGTPEPFLSTLPTILLAPPGFAWWGWKKRTESDRSGRSISPLP
jgi:hypothetical protein